MKAADREESDQTDMAVVIEYLRDLRDETGAAAALRPPHRPPGRTHARHERPRVRLGDTAHVQAGRRQRSRHRHRSTPRRGGRRRRHLPARLGRARPARCGSAPPCSPSPNASSNTSPSTARWAPAELAKGIETRRSDVDRTLLALEGAGTTRRGPSGKLDGRDDPPLTRCGISVAKRYCRSSRTPDDTGRPTRPWRANRPVVPPL